MKRKKFIMAAALAVTMAAIWAVPGIVRDRADRELKRLFPGALTSIGKFSIERPPALSLSDIIVDGKSYRLAIQKASINPSLDLTLTGIRLQLTKIVPLLPNSTSAAGAAALPVRIRQVRLNDLAIQLRLPTVKGDIRGSVSIDVPGNRILTAHLESPSLAGRSVKWSHIVLDLPGRGAGWLTADALKIGKLEASGVRGEILWEDTTIRIDPITASWIRGAVAARAQLLTEDPFDYDAEIELHSLDLGAFSDQMELNKKMTAEGRITGRISLNGNRHGVRFLKGSFASEAGGGNLVIQDLNWLKYLARNTRQRLELVEAAFKEYHFDTAAAAMTASGRDLKFAIRMNGDKGRRDFEVNLHDQL